MANPRLWHLAQQLRQLTSAQAEAQALWNDQAGAQISGRYLRPHAQRAAHQVGELTAQDRALDGVGASVRAARVHYEEARIAGERVGAEIQEAQYAASVTHDFIRRALTNEGRAAQLQEQAVAAAEQANAIGGSAPGEQGQTRAPVGYTPLPRRTPVVTGDTLAIMAGWRMTTLTPEQSLAHHHRKHGRGRTPQEYTQDARDWAANPTGVSKPHRLNTDPPGVISGTKYRTRGGPGGILDSDGGIVTFWYTSK